MIPLFVGGVVLPLIESNASWDVHCRPFLFVLSFQNEADSRMNGFVVLHHHKDRSFSTEISAGTHIAPIPRDFSQMNAV
jgi:hypothetical protein